MTYSSRGCDSRDIVAAGDAHWRDDGKSSLLGFIPGWRRGLSREIAERHAFGGLGDDFGQRRLGEGLFYLGQGVVQALVERAEADAVGGQAQGAGADALNALYRVDDLEDSDFRRGSGQAEAAVEAPLGRHKSFSLKVLHHLREVSLGDAGDLGDFVDSAWTGGLVGEEDGGPKGVFDGLGNHERDMWTLTSTY